MSLVVNQYYHCDPDKLDRILKHQEKIMSELTDLRDSVAELKKDGQRALDALAAVRVSNAEIRAALDDLKKNTNLNTGDRAAVDEIKTMVSDSDSAIETAVPEVPAPPPVEEPPPPPAG